MSKYCETYPYGFRHETETRQEKSFSSSTVTVENTTYEIANFTTVPFHSVAEFKEYRERKVTIPCLRTISDWDAFWLKSDTKTSKTKVRDMAWAVLNSCIIGHRAGFWTIPKLNELSGAERVPGLILIIILQKYGRLTTGKTLVETHVR